MKRIAAGLLACTMALSLVACSGSQPAATDSKPAENNESAEVTDVALKVWAPQDDQPDGFGLHRRKVHFPIAKDIVRFLEDASPLFAVKDIDTEPLSQHLGHIAPLGRRFQLPHALTIRLHIRVENQPCT